MDKKLTTLLQPEFVHTLPYFRAVCLMVLTLLLTAQQLLQSIQSTTTNLILQSQKWLMEKGTGNFYSLILRPQNEVGVTWVQD